MKYETFLKVHSFIKRFKIIKTWYWFLLFFYNKQKYPGITLESYLNQSVQ